MLLFILALFYANAIQGALLLKNNYRGYIDLDAQNAGWLLAAPGMKALIAVSNDLRDDLFRQYIGMRFSRHRDIAAQWIAEYQPYENMERGIIPDDAIMLTVALGINFYYIPELRAIDRHGLTDYTVARTPVHQPNSRRSIAHDRRPPPGYLKERGVNIIVQEAATTAEQALARSQYAVQVGPDLWMPFDSPDDPWTHNRFSGRTLSHSGSFLKTHPTIPSANQVILSDGRLAIGERFIGDFESSMNGWRIEGDAVTNHADFELYQWQKDILGNIGAGFLTTYHPIEGDIPTGSATSPKFAAESGEHLAFLIAGGDGDGVGARLLSDGDEVAVWRGQNTEWFKPVIYPLAEHAGKTLQLQLFDNESAAWGHIMLDHVIILR